MEGMLYISCVRFSMQLLIGETVFLLGMERKKRFGLRLMLSFIGYYVASGLIYRLFVQIPGENPIIYTLYYISLFLLTMYFMWVCFQAPPKEILFAGVCGYATQHVGFAVSTIIREITGLHLSVVWDFIVLRLLPYIFMALLVYFVFVRRYEGKRELRDKDIRMILLALVILFTVVFLSSLLNISLFQNNVAYLRNVFCKIYAILCSVLAIFIAFYLSRQNRLLREKEMMEEMLHSLREQQRMSKENIDIINIKCHDLKYRISKIARIEDREHQQEYIEEVKKAVGIFDNIYQTGNDALDLVLTEKSLLCDKYNIRLSCMVDGSVLGFMDTTDVYVLFGNMLDNAIESVMKEEDEERRIISIRIAKRSQGLHIHVDNYCKEEISFEDGLPLTTKKDKEYHGFGVKSIKYLVDRYKGDLLMQVIKQRFQVDILFYI